MVHTKKNVKVKEKDVRDALAKRLGGETEWGSPAGLIDVFTQNEVIEVKHYIHQLEEWDRSGDVMRRVLSFPKETSLIFSRKKERRHQSTSR